jgi:hypothetical protein
MFPLTDGIRPKRFPIVNVAIIAACFVVWILYELPQLNSSVREASFYVCDRIESRKPCDDRSPGSVGELHGAR